MVDKSISDMRAPPGPLFTEHPEEFLQSCKQRNLAPGTRVTVHPPYEEVAMHGAPNVIVCTYSVAFD